MDESKNQTEWEDAVRLFRICHDQSAIVKLLRKLHDPHEIPDLCFLADLLEGKFDRKKGAQKKNKIIAGIEQTQAYNTVADIMFKENLTVEEAVEKAAEMVVEMTVDKGDKPPKLSESSIKKHYYKLKK